MTGLGLTWLLSTGILFVGFLTLIGAEQKRERRFVFSGVRGRLDKIVGAIGLRIVQTWDHFRKYILQLGWYYGLHSFLRALLKTVVALYERVERVFEENHKKTRQLRAEKKQVSGDSHLVEMAQHKADTALTPAEKTRLKAAQLEGD